MRKNLYRICFCLFFISGFALVLFDSCKKDENKPTPVIITTTVSNIAQTSAISGGEITSDGGTTITARGVCWSAGTTPTIGDQKTIDGSGTGSFASIISGLTPNAKYYVRAYATNKAGTGYGRSIEFITIFGQAPILSTSPISNITETSATCGGEITSDGGLPISLRGVCYSTNPNPTLADEFTTNGKGTGTFISNITGIATGKTFYIRAYASNSFTTSYGNERSFSTIVLPTLTTSTCYDIQGISAMAGGILIDNGGDPYPIQGLCWSISPDPSLSNSFNKSFNGIISGLSPNTVYYIKAYATNKAGTSYGNQVSFNSGYIMGYSLGGGLVFYNDGNSHGLICAASDQSTSSTWGCHGIYIGAISTGVNTGSANTDTIVSGCSAPVFAAKICNDLVLKKYTDWYLPSTDELNLMYVKLHKNNLGDFASYYYWSSSEFGNIDAWLQDFSSGKTYYYLKNSLFNVRAVRNF